MTCPPYAYRSLFLPFQKPILCAVTLSLLASCSGKGVLRPPPPELDVVQCRLMSNGEYVGVRLRLIGVEKFDPMAMEAYLVDEPAITRSAVAMNTWLPVSWAILLANALSIRLPRMIIPEGFSLPKL